MSGEQRQLDISQPLASLRKTVEAAAEECLARAAQLREALPTLPERQIRALGGTGVLTQQDLVEFGEAEARIESLMLDGQWHNGNEIIATAGQREGLRRMRELRRRYTVERRRVVGTRDFEYRLVRGS